VRDAGLPAVVLRLGGIYGPGRDRLVRELREGRARLRPGPPRYTNRIHRDDAAAALLHLLDLAEPAPLQLGVDCEPADQNDVLRWLARALGLAVPPFGDAERPAGGRPGTSKRCRNARLLASGFVFRYPTYREGYAGTLLV
jgi:nucleoside-diphosphate-sugar epimerase